jgi:hypothetical protein
MPLATYSDLKTSVLQWLARPGDPLVEPAVPDMIRLFEVEANRRLKQADAEMVALLEATEAFVGLPAGCTEVRLVLLDDGSVLQYVPPVQLPRLSGVPYYYTIQNHTIAVGPVPEAISLTVVYLAGLVPLSDSQMSNWLLASAPDAYLFGVLVEAEAFIGHDERAVSWLQRREAAFAGLEAADRKLRWPGGLQIRVDGITGSGGGSGGGAVVTPHRDEPGGPTVMFR